MRIQWKLFFLLLLICGILLLELTHIINVEKMRVKASLERQIEEKRTFIVSMLECEADSLEGVAVQVARSRQVGEWIERSMPKRVLPLGLAGDIIFRQGNVAALGILSSNCSYIHLDAGDRSDPSLEELLPPVRLKKILAGVYFHHFFVSSEERLYEARIVPIWLMGAGAKLSTPGGYVVVTRAWDSRYLARLTMLSNARIALSLKSPPAGAPRLEPLFWRDLRNDEGKAVAEVVANLDFPATTSFFRSNRRIIILFGAFALLIVAMLLAFFLVWIVRPLRILVRALHQQDSIAIQKLLGQKNEFGHLSRLLLRFFNQREELLHEIRDRKRVEQNLKVKEEKYRNLIENQGEGVVVLDAQEYFLFSNPAAERMFGVFPQRLIGFNLGDFLDEAQFALIEEQTQQRSLGRKTAYEMAITRADGELCWIFVNATPQFESNGALTSYEIFVDITDRKNAEAALMESESKFRRLTEAIPSGIFILQKEKFRYVNSYLEYLTGFKREEFFSMKYLDIVHPSFRQTVTELSEQLEREENDAKAPYRLEIKILTRENQERWVDFTIDTIDFFKEKAILGSIYDISDRKRMEEEIIKTQKMESVAQLAGGIAHDFNNYLTAILGNISLARVKVKSQQELGGILRKVENATLRARDLSQQLLTFSRGGDPVKEVMELGPLVEETVGFVLSGSRVKANLTIERKLWPVEIDESQISQVFNNLIINAVEAMAERGTIEIHVENEKFPAMPIIADAAQPPPPADGAEQQPPSQYVKITFRDYGRGIDQKDLPKIFDPYFTTKKGGIGLGLAVVYSIINKHGGSIHVQSEVGQGTTFFIWLRAASEGMQSKKQRKRRGIHHGQGRILLMDDEDFIREVGSELLQFLGYKVEVTQDGEETIARYRSALEEGDPYAAVIMDLTIPGKMGGMETIKILKEIDPEVRAVVSSGYSNDPVMSDFRRFGFRGIVVKPYKIETLSEVLKEVLAQRESR